MHDGELLRDYVENRSEAAFTRLVERHVNLVYSAALRRTGGQVENAKDVTQRVFIRLARKAGSLLKHPTLYGWLHRTACLEAVAWQRAEARRVTRERNAGLQLDGVGGESEGNVDWSRVKPVIDEVLLELNERDRLAILLRVFAGQSLTAVGTMLGMSENAARMRVDRALDKLKMRLGRRGITSTAGALSAILAANTVQAAPTGLVAGIASVTVGAGPLGMFAFAVRYFLMTKVQLAVAGGVLALLVTGASREWREIARLKSEFATHANEVRGRTVGIVPGQSFGRSQSLTAAARGVEVNASGQTPDRLLLQKKMQDRSYAALFRHLRLPGDRLERLKELLANRENEMDRAQRFVRGTGLLDLTESENNQVRAVVNRASDGEIHELLGDEDYRYFQDYDRALYTRILLTSYVDEMRQLGDPLTDLQTDRLVNLMHASSPSMIERARELGDYEIPDAAIDAATEFLTPAQSRRLESLQNEHAAKIRLVALNRVAAQQGKLELTEQSARDYPGSPVTRD